MFHLDRLFWKAGWKSITREELKREITKVLALDSWIIDGNFGETMNMRIEAADTIIFLDFPVWLCLWNVVKRRIEYSGKTRPDMTEGCNEKIDLEFIMWIVSFPFKRRKANYEKLKSFAGEKNILIYRNRKEVGKFLFDCEIVRNKEKKVQ
ncbi:MAG: AAA family ATPase [Alkaliphilus sp.]|nr:AAA family ATPase [bacterium AH-315-L21]PHS34806.1 MAG: AAA family ATPase [Alkaliphilus sp.]